MSESFTVSSATQPMDATAPVRQLVEAINSKDWFALQRLLHPEFQRHSMAAGVAGVETATQFVRFLMDEHETYPDAREELLDVFSSGVKVAARHLFTGTQLGALGPYPPTGKRVRSVYLALYRVENGAIVESWAEWDPASDIRQLGHLQTPAETGSRHDNHARPEHMSLAPWSELRMGNGCPLCAPRPPVTELAYFVCKLPVSSVYLVRDQTYRGTCAVIYDPAHATRPSELTQDAWRQFSADARLVEASVSRAFQPDHVNVECLGNTVPHLHFAIIPRYRSDPRWGRPIWTMSRDEISATLAGDAECAGIAELLQQQIQVAD